jgi:hypothetical protein
MPKSFPVNFCGQSLKTTVIAVSSDSSVAELRLYIAIFPVFFPVIGDRFDWDCVLSQLKIISDNMLGRSQIAVSALCPHPQPSKP